MVRRHVDLSLFVMVAQEERDTISSLCAFWTDCVMVPKKLPDRATILEAISSVGMGQHLLNNEIPKFLRLARFYEERKAGVNLDDVRYAWNRFIKSLDVVNFKFNSLYDKMKLQVSREHYGVINNSAQLPSMTSPVSLADSENEGIGTSVITISSESDESGNENIYEDIDIDLNVAGQEVLEEARSRDDCEDNASDSGSDSSSKSSSSRHS
ncbi:uncharacterized protein [Rhodnius prolixus]